MGKLKIDELSWASRDAAAYDNDLLLDIQCGLVVLLIRGRNAWHSTWVRHYLRDATLYTDVICAKDGAEGQRGPGNVFYVIEAPAIQLVGMASSAVLCDAHPDNPFGAFTGMSLEVREHVDGSWIDGVFPGVSVQDAVGAFAHDSGFWAGPLPSPHSLRGGRLSQGEAIEECRLPLYSFESEARGSKYRLGWKAARYANKYSLDGARKIIVCWADSLSAVQAHSPGEANLSRQLISYREDVLKAMPKSVRLQLTRKRLLTERRAAEKESEARRQLAAEAEQRRQIVWQVEQELREAREARMHPAETAAGIRAQRERYERALLEIERLKDIDDGDGDQEPETEWWNFGFEERD